MALSRLYAYEVWAAGTAKLLCVKGSPTSGAVLNADVALLGGASEVGFEASKKPQGEEKILMRWFLVQIFVNNQSDCQIRDHMSCHVDQAVLVKHPQIGNENDSLQQEKDSFPETRTCCNNRGAIDQYLSVSTSAGLQSFGGTF